MSEPVGSVVVVGDDIAGAMAALALARAYARQDLAVTLVRTGLTLDPTAGLMATPDIRPFHRLLGIDEARLLRETSASLSVGCHYADWSGDGSGFLHAYGQAGLAFASLPFVQHWVRARKAGLKVALEDFCLAAAAARHGRIAATSDRGGQARYGYHLDAGAYAALLLRCCSEAGVFIRDEPLGPVEIDGGRVAAVRLGTEDRLAADFFVDADGRLIGALDPAGEQRRAGRCDRLLLATAPLLDPIPLYARVVAHRAGWASLVPLRDRTALALAYAHSAMSDDEAQAALPGIAGVPIVDRAAPVDVRTTVRARPWMGNCVAVGAAASSPPPLDAAPLLGLQLGVGQLVLLFPVDRHAMPEAGIYNAEVLGQAARLEDFAAIHFHLNGRSGEPFWDAARREPISPELEAKIALFRARGMFPHFDQEPYADDSWALCLTGHDLHPRGYDPQADRLEETQAIAAFQAQLRAIAERVGTLETHAAALARLGKGAS